ncbi:MAG: endoglucanase, partial [Chloroflexi bacterium]|nr:endoglucanase [Chloroflexota bacterium]
IPRMKALIEQHYPGLKLGLSEWNWGADESMNGALAIADVLGILGREDVYFAAYWRFPPAGSPGFYAFKLFTNYDDQGGRFGETAVWTQVEDVNRISSYAATNATTGNLHVMLINKQPQATEAVQIQITNFVPGNVVHTYQYSPSDLTKIEVISAVMTSNAVDINLPAYSITHLVIEPNN